MKHKILYITSFLMLFLTGCAGTNFTQPEPEKLTLGKTTKPEVIQIMGKPVGTAETIVNDAKLEQVRYAYAATGGQALYPDVIPARSFILSFFQNILVSKEFTSSFKNDHTDFNNDLIEKIEKGKTTRSEVIELLGKPSGEAIYPVIKSKEDQALIYAYNHTTGTVFNLKFYSKLLIISFNHSGIVTDVIYTSNGTK